jgi:macrolide transport system ATP-binding/permease protein
LLFVMSNLWRRLKWFLHRARYEREMEEEIRFHLALKATEQGNAEASHRHFGNITLIKEDSRRMWTGTFWEQLAQDIRYGIRAMTGNKLFSVMAILSLALAVGANTAIYSFMDAIMIKAMPVQHPQDLVILNWRASGGKVEVVHHSHGAGYDEPGGGQTSPIYPYPAYEFLRDNNHVLASLFAYANANRLNLVIDGQAELGNGEYVSGGYFSGLGLVPAAGRLIGPDDDRDGAAPVAAITYGFWQRRFGASPDVAGKRIVVNGKPFTIAGVAAPEFFGVRSGTDVEVFIPVHQMAVVDNRGPRVAAWFRDSHGYWLETMGRLRPGITAAQAQAELSGKFHGWVSDTATNEKERANLPALWLQDGGSGVDSLRRRYSQPLYILMSMVGLILMIACANIANLLLSRAEARRREMAVRLSLGAGRLRVIRQLLTESTLLSLTGGILGIFFAWLGIQSLTWMLANGKQNFSLHAALDLRVLGFTLLVSLLTGLAFGLAPALQATRVDVAPALKETRAGARRTKIFALSHVLVVSQIAVSLLLVAAAGLFVRTLNNLHSVNLGFNQENVLLFSLNGAQAGLNQPALKNLYSELQRRFRLTPNVRQATLASLPLVGGSNDGTDIKVPDYQSDGRQGSNTSVMQIAPGFFETMQIPILMGRPIDERDRDGAQVTAVVNEVFAKRYFPDQSPIGRHFAFDTDTDVEIVGIARTARYSSLKREIPPVTYLSYLQTVKNWPIKEVVFELRTTGDPLASANTVRQVVHEVSPQVPVADLTTQALKIDSTISNEKTFAELCTCFGALALVMACVGLYGTMAYAVSRRTSEIGIRIALGAERRRIIWMVLRQVLILGAVGVIVGMTAVWETTKFLKSYLFGLQPNDPITLAVAVSILVACAIIAGYAPAWRASRIDPMVALRHE